MNGEPEDAWEIWAERCRTEFPVMNGEPEDAWEIWAVFGTSLSPTFEYVQALCAWCARTREPDDTIHFRFASRYAAADEAVHESRLTFASGPLAALATRDFLERSSRLVTLCDEDDPDTFGVIRDFLYAKEISLAEKDLQQLLATVRSAHRWQLGPLFNGLCAFLVKHDRFSDVDKLLSAVDIISLPGLPQDFRYYFWDCTAVFFSELSIPRRDVQDEPQKVVDDKDVEEVQNVQVDKEVKPDDKGFVENGHLDQDADPDEPLPIQLKLCPRFPTLWDLALAQNVVPQLMDVIHRSAPRELSVDLLDLVMRYLEPRISNENDVLVLIELLGPDSMRQEYLLSRSEDSERTCSVRAMRLLAKSLIAPSQPRHEMSFSWLTNVWTLTPCRVNFLYGPCVPDASGLELNSWEPPIFNASSAVHLFVETVSSPEEHVMVRVKWTVGAIFPFKYKKMEMVLSILKRSSCECCSKAEHKGREEEGCLYRVTKTVSLEKKKGDFAERIGKEMFAILRKHHDRRSKCPVTELLRVRLVDS